MSEPLEPSEEIVEWLLSLRLSQYTSCFREGGYESLEDCKNLTDERLVELKILPTGHRRRILRSLEALGVKQQSGGEEDEEGGMESGRRRRKPVPHPRRIFLNIKKRGTSCQVRQQKDSWDSEGSQTLPPGVALGTQVEDDSERGYMRPPQPAPRNPLNIQTSNSGPIIIPASMSSCSSSSSRSSSSRSSSSESLSISEMPSDWEVSPEDPTLSGTDSIPYLAEAPHSVPEMVDNVIYEAQPSFKGPAGPRLTRSYKLRHRPVPEIPNQNKPAPPHDRSV